MLCILARDYVHLLKGYLDLFNDYVSLCNDYIGYLGPTKGKNKRT